MSQALVLEAATLLEGGNPESALNIAKRAAVIDPEDPRPRAIVLRALLSLGRLEEAIAVGLQRESAIIEDPEARLLLASTALERGHPSWAIQFLEGMSHDPRARPLLMRGFDELGLHFRSNSLRWLDASEQVSTGEWMLSRPYFVQQMRELVDREGLRDHELQTALDSMEMGQYGEGASQLEDWLARNAAQPATVLLKADLRMAQGAFDEALEVLSREVGESLASEVHNRLGDLFFLSGSLSEAASSYRRALVLNPGDGNAWNDLVRVQIAEGDIEEARTTCERALAQELPQSAEESLERLLAELTWTKDHGGHAAGFWGLAWDRSGGAILEAEVAVRPHDPRLIITGNPGPSTEDSIRVAETVMRQRGSLPGDQGLHVHLPQRSNPVDGGSAGLLFALQIRAAIVGESPRSRIGVTGQLSISGRVVGVGGLDHKLIAAMLHGLDIALIPRENASEVTAVPSEVRRRVEIRPVSTLDEAIEQIDP